jgi:hypothetical protein
MEKHTTQDAIDSLAHLLYNGGWLSVIIVSVLFLLVAVPVRIVREASKIPILFWIIGYILYKKK